METKIITIRRTVEIALSVPVNETQDDVERWAIRNLIPDCLNTESETRHWISDVRFIDNDDEYQENFILVSWPECQELFEYENYQENCTFINGDSLPCSTYLVNKEWYSRLCNGELRKIEDYDVNEEVLCSYGV